MNEYSIIICGRITLAQLYIIIRMILNIHTISSMICRNHDFEKFATEELSFNDLRKILLGNCFK